jgi:NDP-sugar pyrophosphorylase family protein
MAWLSAGVVPLVANDAGIVLGHTAVVSSLRDAFPFLHPDVICDFHLNDSYIWDDVVIGDNSDIRGAIIADGVVIGRSCGRQRRWDRSWPHRRRFEFS